MRKNIIAVIGLVVCLAGCEVGTSMAESQWDDADNWIVAEDSIDEEKVDVFYIASTNVVSAKDENGEFSFRATLNETERKYLAQEMVYVRDSMFQKDFNYFAPFYHQFTFEAHSKYPEKMDSVRNEVRREVHEAFDYYMANKNNGRRFILAGFSQGAEMITDILRHLTPEQYSHLVAAYALGNKITAEDTTNYKTVKPAQGEADTGVVIAYNSVLNSTAGIWDAVAGGTVACINPVNWKTDSTPAYFTFRGEKHKVHVDKETKVLIVEAAPTYYHEWVETNPLFSNAGLSKDCLHHWDILFYTPNIHDNAIKRSRTTSPSPASPTPSPLGAGE